MTRHQQFLATAAVAANVILTAGAIASALALVHFFYRYSWTAERKFSTWQAMLVYYLGPTLLVGLLVAALWLKREYRINLAIACVALVLSLYGGELVLHLIEPPFVRSGRPVMDQVRG